MVRLSLTAVAVCLFLPAVELQDFTIQIENSSINVTVGSSAFFSVRPSAETKSGNWVFKDKTLAQWVGTGVSIDNEYTTRAELFLPNGSLQLNSVTVLDRGEYTVTMFPKTGPQATATITLNVLEPVSKPTILSNNTNPVEYNDTVALTCRASGTAVSYQWLKDNKTIDPGDRIGLSRDNTTLTISGVLRSDEEFTCRAYNMINGNTSDPLRLNVSYGPESLNISINPQLALYVLGSNVNFSCSAVSNPPSEFQWYLNSTSLEQNGQQLIIADITLNNTGNYTCEAFNNATKRYSLTTRDMVVIEPVSKPNVTANATNPIEHNDTVALTCFASGTAVSYQWLEDNSTIIPDKRFGLSGDNRTLTVSGVLRSDGGFMCYAYNAVNGMTSDLYHLDVSYGPDLPNISINPDLPVYISGRAVAFSCSADSNPPSEFEWYLNDTLLQPKGHQLTIDSITLNGTGKYTCHAFNNLTKKYNASTKQILVIEPVSSVNVSANNSKPVENIDTVSLSCSASGSVQTRIWFKNNRAIQDNDRIITTSPDNRTLTIISVNRNDSGTYKCNASNDFSFNSGDTILQINYGPENVSITPPGPVSVKLGHTLALHCSALSVPAGAYEWYNGTSLLKTGQTYTTDSISSYHDGNYTCQVNNIITKKGSTATIQVTVQEISDNNNGNKSNLSGGGIAGIVIAVAVLITAIVIGVWMIMKKVNRAKGGSQQNDIKMASPGNTPSPQTEYATVERKQPNIQTPVPSSNGTSSDATKPRDPDVVYAQPSILQQGAKSPNATTVDNKTDYAELKFR
ncbi:carcinoembryonic antigen-related cell adhesion molecule 5-like isoform X2 [Heptranchias perlo]|uniref:carcinoembryonic antigen-related cell adhesion molecule 5-like isoform X2 n=1 Tax=Heptranchias perlo TaxID=212740 RepID=UPI00355937D8